MFAVEEMGGAQGMNYGGMIAGWAGAVGSVLSAFYEVEAKKEDLKQRARHADFERTMSNLNAHAAEQEAQSILEAGQQESARVGMAYGEALAEAETSAVARGGVVGAGSSAEELVSIKLARDIDRLTIRSNAVRRAGASRATAVNFENRARFAGVSAENFRASARTLNRGMAVLSASLRGGASAMRSWHEYDKRGYD